VHDPSGETRASAINGLGLLGSEGTIAPLLEILRWDKSADLRERAACNLADSGLLTHELRRKAIPELIRFGGDESLDAATRKWTFQALREIAEQNLRDDAAAWQKWYAGRRASSSPRHPTCSCFRNPDGNLTVCLPQASRYSRTLKS